LQEGVTKLSFVAPFLYTFAVRFGYRTIETFIPGGALYLQRGLWRGLCDAHAELWLVPFFLKKEAEL